MRATTRLRTIHLRRERIKNWDCYPFNVPVIRTLDEIEVRSQVLFLVGENGSGKSTLLEAIAEKSGFGLEGGSRNFHGTTTPTVQAIMPLSDALRLSWNLKQIRGFYLRAESFFNAATYLDAMQAQDPRTLDSYGGKSLHQQSHGESFLALVKNRFHGDGLYLMDEPEAALSPQRQLSFLAMMHDHLRSNAGAQFIISTHSPIILAYPQSQILSFDGPRIEEIEYRDTAAYRLTESFLRSPENYLRRLFGELF